MLVSSVLLWPAMASGGNCLILHPRHCVRVAKEMDSKSIGLWPQGFESPRCRVASGHTCLRLHAVMSPGHKFTVPCSQVSHQWT